ncbi:hypothetical protein IJI94_01190 [Candidatus Saccharibacteria bacterium]|nr:hypothetical protein [Candidatus Saccharibacteria bacterium]
MKKFLLILIILTLASCSFFSLKTYAEAASESQKEVISEYCNTIKQSLKTIQYFDVDNRVKLGSKYETALSKFMTPFNVRAVKNNLLPSELTDLQKKFAEQKTTFAADFTTYSKQLEELIAVDCQKDPSSFYDKLLNTREAREKVKQDTTNLNNILRKYKEIVVGIGEKL